MAAPINVNPPSRPGWSPSDRGKASRRPPQIAALAGHDDPGHVRAHVFRNCRRLKVEDGPAAGNLPKR